MPVQCCKCNIIQPLNLIGLKPGSVTAHSCLMDCAAELIFSFSKKNLDLNCIDPEVLYCIDSEVNLMKREERSRS